MKASGVKARSHDSALFCFRESRRKTPVIVAMRDGDRLFSDPASTLVSSRLLGLAFRFVRKPETVKLTCMWLYIHKQLGLISELMLCPSY